MNTPLATPPPDHLLTPPEIADFLHCSQRTVSRMIARSAIPIVRLGRLIRADRGRLVQHFRNCATVAPTTGAGAAPAENERQGTR